MEMMIKLPSRLVPRARQRGMSLIEILVAIVVLSIGLLGLAGLQLKGIQVNQGSVYRWQAALLAEDIADRMRADRSNAANKAYTLSSATTGGTGTSGTAQAISDWLQRVTALPGGKATILDPVVTPTGEVQIGITIVWSDTRAQSGSGVSTGSSTYNTSGTYSVTVEL
jgi:type IV pilus assembly protein PilV